MRAWKKPCEHKQSMFSDDVFVFLNESRRITNEAAWNDPAIEKLWLYNLHYFDDLNATDAIDRRGWHSSIIARWIAENPPGYGNGWEPYPSSLRVVNWIKYALGGGELSAQAIASLAVQVRFLCERLEFHLMGNHLLANAKALLFAGIFFEGKEAQAWYRKGLTILKREMAEQILKDGGHFERSPMYHSIILEDMLDIDNIARTFGLELVCGMKTIEKMRSWLGTMSHPDGEISFFNDAAFGIAPNLLELNSYAERLGCPFQQPLPDGLRRLPESGYVRAQKGIAVVLIDVAPVGPDYLPGHAHADSLSFELSLLGQRLIVNSGTSCYGSGTERQRQRGTAAHNTLLLNGHDSSEIWGGFRVARRAQVRILDITESASDIRVNALHDGYRRLPGNNIHRRSWCLGDASLMIEDEVTGKFEHAEVRFHLHPEIKVVESCDLPSNVSLRLPCGKEIAVSVKGGELYVEAGSWHPYFGVSVPNVCLVAVLDSPKIRTTINWGLGS